MRIVAHLGAFFVAVAIATFLTSYLAFAGLVAIDVWDGASPVKFLELVNPLGWVSLFGLAFILGGVGAALFLGVSFLVCAALPGRSGKYGVAGALAGASHSLIGLSLWYLDAFARAPAQVVNGLVWIGGFGLYDWPRSDLLVWMLPASVFAGWLAGSYFGRFARASLATDAR